MQVVQLCKNCGRTAVGIPSDLECDFCKCKCVILDISEQNYYAMTQEEKAGLRFKVQPREQYNDEAWNKRIEWEENRNKRFSRIAAEVNAHPTCPYCGSKNTKSINSFDRLTSTMFWGLGSSKIGKQQHCKNCGKNF